MSRNKPLHKKDHLRASGHNNARVAFTGEVIPGAFNVQNGRMRQRPQIATDSYTPYLEGAGADMQTKEPLQTDAVRHEQDASKTGAMFMPASGGLAEARPVFVEANNDQDHERRAGARQDLSLWEVERIKTEAEQNVQQQARKSAVAAEEYDEKQTRTASDNLERRKRRRCIAIVLFLVLLAVTGIVVGTVLGLQGQNDNGPGTSKVIGEVDARLPTSSPTTSPTSSPTVFVNVTNTNVDCLNAIEIETNANNNNDDDNVLISVVGSTRFASEAVSDETPVCGSQVVNNGLGMWYRLPGNNQVWTISTCNNDTAAAGAISTTFDSQISVFESSLSGSSACSELLCRTSNDQFCGDQSQVTFTTVAGKLYHIFIHGYRDQRGVFRMQMYPELQNHYTCENAKKEPASWNELVGSTFELQEAIRQSESRNEDEAIDDNIPRLSCNPDGTVDTVNPVPGLWYEVIGTGSTMTVSTCSDTATYDARVSIVTAGASVQTADNETAPSAGGCGDAEDGNDFGAGFQCVAFGLEDCPTQLGRIVSFPTVEGMQYHAIIHGPADDATFDPSTVHARHLVEHEDALVNIDVSGDLDRLNHKRHQQRSGLLRALQTNADDSNSASRTADQFEVGIIIIDDIPPGAFLYNPMSRCNEATELDLVSSTNFTVEGTIQPSPPLTIGDDGSFSGTCGSATYSSAPGVWFKLVGNGRTVSLSTCDDRTKFDTQITVFRGDCTLTSSNDNATQLSTPLTCVTGNDQSVCGDGSYIKLQTELGEVYRVLVHGYGSRVGDFVLSARTDPTLPPTPSPTALSSSAPSMSPSTYPPSGSPTLRPTVFDSILPALSGSPSTAPSSIPTVVPTPGPSGSPSTAPSSLPTTVPTPGPSGSPSAVPSSAPTQTPSQTPSLQPTSFPTSAPSAAPSGLPTAYPTASPTLMPSSSPSGTPSLSPSVTLSVRPTSSPTYTPSAAPSGSPTELFSVEDACAGAVLLQVDGSSESGAVDPVSGDIGLESFEGTCSLSEYRSPWGAWYRLEGTNRLTAIDACSEVTSFDIQITVFEAVAANDGTLCSNLQCVAGNDTPCGLVWWQALPGRTYYVFVHAINEGDSGAFLLNIRDQAL